MCKLCVSSQHLVTENHGSAEKFAVFSQESSGIRRSFYFLVHAAPHDLLKQGGSTLLCITAHIPVFASGSGVSSEILYFQNPPKSTQVCIAFDANGVEIGVCPLTWYILHFRTQSKVCGYLVEGALYDIVVRMGVNIQRHAGVGMSHEILKTFDVDARLLHIGAEGMAQHMRGHLGEISTKCPRMLSLLCP